MPGVPRWGSDPAITMGLPAGLADSHVVRVVYEALRACSGPRCPSGDQSVKAEEDTFGDRSRARPRAPGCRGARRAGTVGRLLVGGLLHHFVEPASTPWTK
ncbi:hypothetical protein GCM10010492_01930 [Saccharothrix mutabilis subsp. mutabilis]|uniref:Uncharacterized protein n=1 Tax=Saccharothrix mutabilis subsp. mutabilis TaxID=66855 RepID=A0ABN0T032_9PSEU